MPPLTRLRAQILASLGLSAAVACEPQTPPRDPSSEGATDAGTHDAAGPIQMTQDSADAATKAPPPPVSQIPLPDPKQSMCPTYPPDPPGRPGEPAVARRPRPYCQQFVACTNQNTRLTAHYPPPFEHCGPNHSGTFEPETTGMRIKAGGQECCYRQALIRPVGRPVREDGVVVLAPVLPKPNGTTILAPRSEPCCQPASVWFREIAAVEHSSVVAFFAIGIALARLGAEANLLLATSQAAADEVQHTTMALALAEEFGGESFQMDCFPSHAGPPDLDELIFSTVVDGCFGESVGALEAEAAARTATHEGARAFWRRVWLEESKHAELAFRIVAFGYALDPATTESAIARGLDAIARMAPPEPTDADLRPIGGLPECDRAAIRHAVRSSLLPHCLEAIREAGVHRHHGSAPRAARAQSHAQA